MPMERDKRRQSSPDICRSSMVWSSIEGTRYPAVLALAPPLGSYSCTASCDL
jgi:hypothetical protein